MQKSIVTFLLIAGLFFTGYTFYKNIMSPDFPGLEMDLQDINGKKFDRNSLNGKYILVSYFKSWCGDCIREIPSIRLLQTKVGEENLAVVFISDEADSKISAFRQRFGAELEILKTNIPFKNLGIHAYPTTFLLDPNGKILMQKQEGFDWSKVEVLEKVKALN